MARGRTTRLAAAAAAALAATAALCVIATTARTSRYDRVGSMAQLATRGRSVDLCHHHSPAAQRRRAAVVRAGFGAPADAPSEKKVSQDLALMTTLLPKLGQAKSFGVDPRDYIEQPPIESKLAVSIDTIAKGLEENFEKRGGYSVSKWKEVLGGEWQLLFTTSQVYRDNRGLTGYSGLPGYGLQAIYSRLVPDEQSEEVDGRAVAIEVLTAPFGKKAKNELRGAYKIYSKNDSMKKKQVVLDQSFVRGDTGGEFGKEIKGNLLMYNTYITKDAKLRFGRSANNALYIYGRVGEDGDGTKGGINEILSRDRLPWDGGTPLFRVF